MLPSQRHLFDLPREVAYLNAAAWSPLPLAVQEAGRMGVGRKGRPWEIDPALPGRVIERARAAAAALIGAAAEDVAVVSSVGYGVASAAKVFAPPAGSRVVVLEDDHSSPVLEWMVRAPAQGFTVDTVKRPSDGDWTAAVEAAIAKPGAPVSLASISNVHWSDGSALDMDRIAAALKAKGAALLIDATHGAGMMDLDVKRIDPDFLIFPTYKWVLGPYGRAFAYVAKRWQRGVPLEQTAFGRKGVAAERVPYFADLSYVDSARRYDMGERDHFVGLEMAAVGLEMMAGWTQPAIAERCAMLTARLEDGLAAAGALLPKRSLRAPHVLCVSFAGGMPAGLAEALGAQGAYAAPRLGRLRISPHVYNDEEDVDRFVAAFARVVKRAA
ncbi:aminotransferase class V-fold PLP-dependent enzyme [Neoroseomonas oryzicola]|uniref:Aminotransferase class V-fold PLP-dependent enzyme n=1 Tax=Neoroseomonas oryzicola TaxID=535904 RepID=A0A9X9WGQ6_9PROT|nr:aminotransferase class V-fold PLP-dependent enzyme [Neoroseomonas oryzicola]MBR0659516.1 aminotransferase class V-fold PLP-dependent enzyme [Neoroseomonas oryzicola]NKE16205.1 aminotransferase class V-fold PLP-dependent enzyme [Neoroseomonas oryzicola]